MAYTFVADSMGLPSFKFVQWAPKYASFLQKTFKVTEGRYDFGTNRKRVCVVLSVGHCDYGPILHRF